jgi:hypothetical protein
MASQRPSSIVNGKPSTLVSTDQTFEGVIHDPAWARLSRSLRAHGAIWMCTFWSPFPHTTAAMMSVVPPRCIVNEGAGSGLNKVTV